MTEKLLIQGPVGQIEFFVDRPEVEQKGFAVVCHPHPQQGGTPRHKVPVLLAQIFNEMGYCDNLWIYKPLVQQRRYHMGCSISYSIGCCHLFESNYSWIFS